MFTLIHLALCCTTSLSPADDAVKELMALQGAWKCIGGEEVGSVLSEEDAKKEDEQFVFAENTLTVKRRGKVIGEFSVSLKPGKDKGEIDLKHKSGKYEGKICHGIYHLEGLTLKICTASKMRSDEAKDRPTVFSTRKSDEAAAKAGTLLFILRQQKE
jgi:uncharacterized protein (TIGR03067 family)